MAINGLSMPFGSCVTIDTELTQETVVLDSSIPTTKLCTSCGRFNDEMSLWDRTFRCQCGVEEDRDVHAADNMVWFYENNVGVGRTNLKRC